MKNLNKLLGQDGPFDKKEFPFNQKVRIKNTGTHFDGKVATVIGVSTRYVLDSYIIYFDKPETIVIDPQEPGETFQAIVLTESCLDWA